MDEPGSRARLVAAPIVAACLMAFGPGWVVDIPARGAEEPAAKPGDKPAVRPAEQVHVETSDGWKIPVWYHLPAVTSGTARPAAVILLHDLGGSHTSVGALAEALRSAGNAVAVPDLRGHGRSEHIRVVPKDLKDKEPGSDRLNRDAEPWEKFRKADFEMMAASGGGQKRDQATYRGDVESVRNWLRQRADCDFDRLVVVGSGFGATLAAVWTAHDWSWPDLPAEQQGRQVRGLVLISPAKTYKGFAFPATSDAIQKEVPVMLLAGRKDEEALRLFQRFKPDRSAWFEQRAGAQKPNRSKKLEDDKDAVATLYLLQFDTASSGDALAAFRAPAGKQAVDPASLIHGFTATLKPPAR